MLVDQLDTAAGCFDLGLGALADAVHVQLQSSLQVAAAQDGDRIAWVAQQAGFTKESFETCMKNEAVAKDILAVRSKAEGFGVTGIPTFFVNGERFEGETTIEAFRAKIDPLLT